MTRWPVFRIMFRGLAVVVLAGGVLWLLGFRLRLEMAGSGRPGFFSIHRPQAHYAALEKRTSAPSQAPAAAPAEPSPAASATAASPEPSPAPAAAAVPAAYWTGFRGPRRDGRYEEMPIRTDWPAEGLPLLWRQPIGGGYASFVVAEGRAFTIEQRRHQEAVTAYDLETGRELWTHAWDAEFREIMGGDGPRATPTWDEGRVYALGATGELRCLDARSGGRLWSRNILADSQAENLNWGMAASPLIVDDKVIVLPGGSAGKSVVAYHKRTGEPVWKALDDRQAYTAPMLVTLSGRRQILVVSAHRAMGLEPADGSLLWEYPWRTEYDVNAAQPIVLDENRFFLSAGYDHGATVVEVSRTENGFSARTVWENKTMKNRFNSSVLHQGFIYGLDEGIFVCIDARTGERKWKGGRYGYGQTLVAGQHLIVTTESGDVVLVKPSSERLEEVARFSALEGKTWNNPAIAHGRLLVRNATQMAAFNIAAR